MKDVQPLIDRVEHLIERLQHDHDQYWADIAALEYCITVLVTCEATDAEYDRLLADIVLMEQEADQHLGVEGTYA